MKKYILFFILAVLVFYPAPVRAQYDSGQSNESDVPSGMVSKKVNGGVTVLMPKGGKMHRTNETTYVEESSDEYAARNFESVENRLKKLERENKEFREDINSIKAQLSANEKSAEPSTGLKPLQRNNQETDKNVTDADKE